ncbi:MAG: hypothetical protein U9N83_08935 [Thermodesulfobacteriota bacterium]|nr:hypothetical protein [Thermodesulfobacteriota bacterium]
MTRVVSYICHELRDIAVHAPAGVSILSTSVVGIRGDVITASLDEAKVRR